MTIEPQPRDPNFSADTIYSLVNGPNATVTQNIYGSARKPNLFQLPTDNPNFTGRSKVIQTIEAILTSKNPTALISAVSGMGGVGKSALATHMGHRLKAQYPDGQLYVDLRGQSESPKEPIAVLSDFLVYGFGIEPQQLPLELDALRGVYLSQLSGKKILVVLDNALDGTQVEALLPGMGCAALVTSREKLTGLMVEEESFVPIDVMPMVEAIDLLRRLCPKKTPNLDLTTTLATLSGGLPLALTIVGKLLFGTTSLTLERLIAELKEERSRLEVMQCRNSRGEVDLKLSVEASFNLSYGLLLPEQQRVFAVVSVLRGMDFGVALAAVLVEMTEAQVQEQLDQLEKLALVQMPEDTVDRYSFHDLVRAFGRKKLEPEQARELGMKALGWYGETADQMDDFVQANVRLERATAIAADSDESVETVDAALLAFGFAWFEAEWLNILEGISWAKITDQADISVKLFAYGMHFAALQGRRNLVFLEAGEKALDAARASGDRLGEANTLQAIGDVLQFLDQRQDALNRYETAIDIYRQVGARLGEANTLQAIGDVLQFLKQSQEALNRYETAIEIYRQVGDRLGEANTLSGLGKICFEEGDYSKALNFYRERIQINQDIGNQYGEAWTHIYVGQTLTKLAQKWDAKQSYESARQIFESIGLTDLIEFCDEAIRELPQVLVSEPEHAPSIPNSPPKRKTKSFPLWQSAIVLLVMSIGWLAVKPHGPAPQNGEVKQMK